VSEMGSINISRRRRFSFCLQSPLSSLLIIHARRHSRRNRKCSFPKGSTTQSFSTTVAITRGFRACCAIVAIPMRRSRSGRPRRNIFRALVVTRSSSRRPTARFARSVTPILKSGQRNRFLRG
jgi:hypothetical protein